MPTTYHVPAGLTPSQKKALAGLLACQPCCGGSGSGSMSSSIVPCCDVATPTTVSWLITGTTALAACTSGTAADNNSTCLIAADDLSAANGCGPASSDSFHVFSYTNTCISGADDTTITISLCCVSNDGLGIDPAFAARYRLGIYLTSKISGIIKSANWCTQIFSIASCSPFHIEIDNLAPYLDEYGGARATVVIT